MKVAVVGGGPAGMTAAAAAAERGAEVTLLEGNEKLGKKLYLTGKGRCNVTNTARGEAFFENVPRNPRFLYSAYRQFDNEDLQRAIEEAGVKLKVERGGRVFPESDKASDITRALEKRMARQGVRVRLKARVREVRPEEGGFVLELPGERLRADRVILACGGASYPSTGSDGGGYALCRALGHTVTPIRPALIPLVTREDWCRQLQGLSLRNVRLRAKVGKKEIYDELGEMLFTHFGISGPLVLTLSSLLPDDPGAAELFIDLKPGLTREMLDKRLLREAEAHARGQVSSMLDTLVPRSLSPVLAEAAGILPTHPAAALTREMREGLTDALKGLPLHVTGFRPLSEAIVTRGGVSVREVDPRTMGSRKVPGLYLCGEMLDVDAFTGGFNLQIAFTTGHAAGCAAAEDPEKVRK